MAYQRQQDLQKQLATGDLLVVVHDFDARSGDELTLRRGERIELVEMDDGFGDGWYLGRHLGREQTGLFPGVYTTKVPMASPNPHFGGLSQRSSLPSPSSTYQPSPVSPILHHSMQPATPPSSFASSSHYHDSSADSDKSSRATSYNTIQLPASRPASSMHSSAYSPAMQRSIGQALSDTHNGQDSTVMHETLSVIDEHMQGLSTPRNSGPLHELSAGNDSESEYSSHVDRRPSHVGGSETDDGEEKLTVDQVRYWDHKQTADHLRGLGVDSRHCDIFEEQEITGDVLLDMDQSFIYMKEYDFGVMGRRLKTWHKIRDFQDAVKGQHTTRQSVTAGSGHDNSSEDLVRTHSRLGSNNATVLQRVPTMNDRPDPPPRLQQEYSAPTENMTRIAPLQTQSSNTQRTNLQNETPPSPWRASMAAASPSRPSAANIRDISHSRRHSSIDFDQHPSSETSVHTPTPTTSHQKQASLDQDWSMAAARPGTPTAGPPPYLRLNTMREQSFYNESDPSLVTGQSAVDIDRGYFSGGEAENRRKGNVLRKRDSLGSPVHSRQSSMLQESRLTSAAIKRHSRLSSVDSIRDVVPPVSTASKAYHSSKFNGRFRSASARTASNPPVNGPISPIVTNLEDEQASAKSIGLSQPGQTSVVRNMTMSDKARRMMGIRGQSEGVPSSEKDLLAPGGNFPNTIMESPVQSPTGSSTPSAASKSFEIDNTDASSKGTSGSILSPQLSNWARPKMKQETSAYTRGLLNVSPAEARKTCDYSGWMKKKSSSLITMWKPRLFILRGRRLSYYYSEEDTMERGIIDISGHKVLVANSDALVTIHAQVTGATSSPVPGYPSQSTTVKASEIAAIPKRTSGGTNSPFYFKLVPPKAGISRAVQFTRPTIHIFQVDSLSEGRKWMGEMMKATIEHDMGGFESTNKQKTISLAKARARKERPPALKEKDEENQENVMPEKVTKASGLQISGLDFETPSGQEGNSMGLLDEKMNGFDEARSLGQTPAPT
jgi:hypothetical protein